MKISRDTVVSLNIIVTDEQGQVLGRTATGAPEVALLGHGHFVPGLEKALDGHDSGDEFSVTLSPEDAFGRRDERKVQKVDRAMFGDFDVQVGNVFEADSAAGPLAVTVTKIEGDSVEVDANHPMAGKTLTFLVEVVDVRKATDEEKQHGHAHPEGHCPSEGHEHHCHHHGGCCHHHHHEEDDMEKGEGHHCCHQHHDDENGHEHHCCHHHDDDEDTDLDGDPHECCCGHHHE